MIKTVSMYDLMEVQEIRTAILTSKEEDFNRYMYALGFDTSEPIQEIECNHRPMFTYPEIKFGIMYSGKERSDKAYIKSGACSMEGRIEAVSNGDMDLVAILTEMSSQPNFSGMMMRHARGEEGVYKEEEMKGMINAGFTS